jgi:hypothetical protein
MMIVMTMMIFMMTMMFMMMTITIIIIIIIIIIVIIIVIIIIQVFSGAGYGGKTEVKTDDHDPWWKEDFNFFNVRENDPLRLEVYDSDVLFDDLLGTCERSIKNGTWQHSCAIKRGGTLYYSYTLEPLQ